MCRNQVFLIFPNNSRSEQNKKNPAHPFVDIGKNCRVVGARQSFESFRLNNWFLQNNRALSKFCVGFCITYLVLSNYNKINP